MGGNGLSPLATFLARHQAQLEAAGVPAAYWPTLLAKLQGQTFDAGQAFSLLQVTARCGSTFL